MQDEIDLHSLRASDAEMLLKRFLNEARSGMNCCVRIVHGKGLRSEGAPVLKMLVDRVLRQRGDVLAFASAPRQPGRLGRRAGAARQPLTIRGAASAAMLRRNRG